MVNLPITCRECGEKHYYYGKCQSPRIDFTPNFARRDAIEAHASTLWCPNCGSNQIQIMNLAAIGKPFQWKCRGEFCRCIWFSGGLEKPQTTDREAVLNEVLEKLQCLHDCFSSPHFDQARGACRSATQMVINLKKPTAAPQPVTDNAKEQVSRNARVRARYDELFYQRKHGHYEMLFTVVREEVERVEKPKPVAFCTMDGGPWILLSQWVFSRYKQARAIKFEDGSIFDMINGWRKS